MQHGETLEQTRETPVGYATREQESNCYPAWSHGLFLSYGDSNIWEAFQPRHSSRVGH